MDMHALLGLSSFTHFFTCSYTFQGSAVHSEIQELRSLVYSLKDDISSVNKRLEKRKLKKVGNNFLVYCCVHMGSLV